MDILSHTPQSYRTYDRQRRINMLRAIISPFILVSALVFVITGIFAFVNPEQQLALRATDAVLLVVIAVLLVGARALQRGRLALAIAIITLISAIGSSFAVALLSYFRGFDVFSLVALTPFTVVILLAGVFGDRWAIIAMTLVMNAVTFALLIGTHLAHLDISNLAQNFWLVLPVIISYQWLFALLMMVIERAFRSTLHEVSTSYDHAQQVDVLKDSFISSVNHELRTPLMAMLTILATVRDNDQSLTPEQRQYWLTRACDQGDALADLVKRILSARRVDQEAAEIVPEVVNVRQTLENAIALMDSREIGEQERNVRVQIDPELQVWAGRIELRQILTNLLTNAIKYSEPGTPIEVSASPVPLGSGAAESLSAAPIEITVRDWGHGIPPDQTHLLFNRFTRLPRDLASNVIGNGLGLYLCRLYAEAMGGTISVESTGIAGQGSLFRLHLPSAVLAREGV
jgi:signal transduction histidine kinase